MSWRVMRAHQLPHNEVRQPASVEQVVRSRAVVLWANDIRCLNDQKKKKYDNTSLQRPMTAGSKVQKPILRLTSDADPNTSYLLKV